MATGLRKRIADAIPERARDLVRLAEAEALHFLRNGTADIFDSVDIETTGSCNLTPAPFCHYCPNVSEGGKGRGTGEMPEETFFKIIDELSEMDFSGEIRYAGYGEPFSDRRLPELAGYAKEKLPNAKQIIYTNGTLLTRGKLEAVAPFVDKLVLTNHSGKMPKRLLEALGTNDLESYLGGNVSFGENSVSVEYRTGGELRLTNRAGKVDTDPERTARMSSGCYVAPYQMVITAKGDVIACVNDYVPETNFGNVNASSLMEIWNAPDFTKMRRDVRRARYSNYDICKKCVGLDA